VAKRQTKRKVVITLRPRVPDDPQVLLQAIEDVFRPGEIEITIESPDRTEAAPSCPDEQLETAAREHAAKVLDEQDRRMREAPPKRIGANQAAEKGMKMGAWLAKKTATGWRIFVRVLPVAKKVAEIAKDIGEVAGF
jgi:hypothetical protein